MSRYPPQKKANDMTATDSTARQRELRRRALLLDLICLAMCGILLWCGTNMAIDLWVLIAGAVVAVAVLVAAIMCSAKARRLDIERYKTTDKQQE